jgi:predicted transcriptional regulator
MSNAPKVAAAPEVVSLLEMGAVFSAVCDPVRQALLRVLADGAPCSVKDLAAKLRRPPDGISKHLRILRHARLIRTVTLPGSDGRKQFHEFPAMFRSRDAAGKTVLDFGAVLLRLE